jgi:hypothetical protein
MRSIRAAGHLRFRRLAAPSKRRGNRVGRETSLIAEDPFKKNDELPFGQANRDWVALAPWVAKAEPRAINV